MKKGPVRRGNLCCFLLILVAALQISFILLMRSWSVTRQEQGRLGTGKLSRRLPLSWSGMISSRQSNAIICEQSNHQVNEWCYFNRPNIIVPKRSTFYAINFFVPTMMPPLIEKIRPSPHGLGNFAMSSSVKEITITTTPIRVACQIYHNSPALVFSTHGGYTGDSLLDFSNSIVPIFITIKTFFPRKDVTLVVIDFDDFWYKKYEILLGQFTKHPVINLDNQTATHCFPKAMVGLASHGAMFNPTLLPWPQTFLDFRAILGAAYDECPEESPVPTINQGKPRIIVVNLAGLPVGRVTLNEDLIVKLMEETGFDVVLFNPYEFTCLCKAYKLINASHAMVGVNGEALTHSILLRRGAVLMEVVAQLRNKEQTESYSDNFSLNMAVTRMKFEYMEHRLMGAEESWSLAEEDGDVPVRLDIERFGDFLRTGYLKAKRFMEENE